MRATNTTWWSLTCAALVLLFGLTTGAAPAHAAFNDTESASQKVSTGTLPAPTSAAVSMTCQEFLFFVRPKVTVSSYTSPASRANYYEIKLFDPSGDMETSGDISKTSSAQPYTYTGSWQGRNVTWRYEIRGYYKVPGSTNAWSSTPLTGNLTCP